jgi:hypothetical protein
VASFGIKNRNILNYCEPELVKEAMQRPEAMLLKCFSKIEYSMSQRLNNTNEAGSGQTRGNQSFVLRLLRKLQFWKKNSTAHPDTLSLGRDSSFSSELDPPEDFIRSFAEKHAFISQSFSSNSISIWLTVLLFQEKLYMGDSQQSILYTSRMLEQLGSLQQAVRSTFMVVRDISLRDTIDPESANTEASESKLMRFLKSAYLGSEGVCLVRFAKMTYMDLADVMADKGLEAFSRYGMSVLPISQLIEAQRQVRIRSVATKVLRIRDVTPGNTLQQHPMKDEDKHQSPSCDTRNEETFPTNAGRQTPAFGSKPLYQRRVALSNMQLPAIPADSQRIRPQMQSSKLVRHQVTASSAGDDDDFASSVVQPTSRDADAVDMPALKVQKLNKKISDLKKRLKLADTTILRLRTQLSQSAASSVHRTANAVSELQLQERDDSDAEFSVSDLESASISGESETELQQPQQRHLNNLLQWVDVLSEQIADLD